MSPESIDLVFNRDRGDLDLLWQQFSEENYHTHVLLLNRSSLTKSSQGKRKPTFSAKYLRDW